MKNNRLEAETVEPEEPGGLEGPAVIGSWD